MLPRDLGIGRPPIISAAVRLHLDCAHGFQTLDDNCEVFYQMSEMYHPGLAHGARWNDPAFGIRWPVSGPFVSQRDAHYPDFTP